MNFFVYLTFFVVIASVAATLSPVSSTSSSSSDTSSKQHTENDMKSASSSQQNIENVRFRKASGYGGLAGSPLATGIPALPCPKNYLFSCQPNLAPVPCSAPAYSHGSVGAYSAPVPTYMAPLQNNYDYRLAQAYGGFAPQNFNQFYQY